MTNTKPRKKNEREIIADETFLLEAEEKLVETASLLAADLVDHELDAKFVAICRYTDLIESYHAVKRRRNQLNCEMVAPRWPQDENGDYVYNNITLEGVYE
tara:strand:+ start:676 stop:978 length:303 start_codon:yes stop_codon:yes gene_type:complete